MSESTNCQQLGLKFITNNSVGEGKYEYMDYKSLCYSTKFRRT